MKARWIYAAAVMGFILFAPVGLSAQDPNTANKSEVNKADPNEQFKETLKKAEAGDASAQFFMGLMYGNGEGVPQDYKEAAKWYSKAAEQGLPDAQCNLGMMYAKGKCVPQDYKEAVKWYTKAAEQGLAGAQFLLGTIYAEGRGVPQDYKEAIKWFTRVAKQGFAWENVADHKLAEVQFNLAEQGYAEAQFNLGVMYDNGRGVPQDYKEAVKWYTKAAEQGLAEAQYNMGVMYADGEGVAEDYVEAYKWWNLAAAQGNEDAKKNRDIIRQKMSAEQIAEAQRLSKEFKPKIQGQAASDILNPETAEIKGNGTGFFITADGYLLTAYHVVKDAGSVKVWTGKGLQPARVVRCDAANDIALLKVEGAGFAALAVQSSRTVKVGQEIFTMGFPNIQFQGTEAKYTQGNINSLSGIGDDVRLFQISAAVQPGNSGGPLLDGDGQVVGVVVAKLDEIATAKETGSLPQNVNYAMKSSFVLSFLESLPELNGKLIEGKQASLSRTQVVEKAGKAVVMVVCY